MTMAGWTEQRLRDRADIDELIADYARGIDSGDLERFFSVFTEDFEMEVIGGRIRGLAKYRRAIENGGMFKVTGCDVKQCTHAMANARVAFADDDPDTATGIVHCVSYIIGEREGAPHAAKRGIIYHDRYRRENGRWLIAYRRHNLRWLIEDVPSAVDR